MLFNENDARAIAERALGFVKANDGVVTVQGRVHSHLRFAANTFQTNGHSETVGVTVRVWIDRKRGEAFATDASEDSLKAVVEQAEAIARLAPVDVEYLPTLSTITFDLNYEIGLTEATNEDLDLGAKQNVLRGLLGIKI